MVLAAAVTHFVGAGELDRVEKLGPHECVSFTDVSMDIGDVVHRQRNQCQRLTEPSHDLVEWTSDAERCRRLVQLGIVGEHRAVERPVFSVDRVGVGRQQILDARDVILVAGVHKEFPLPVCMPRSTNCAVTRRQ